MKSQCFIKMFKFHAGESFNQVSNYQKDFAFRSITHCSCYLLAHLVKIFFLINIHCIFLIKVQLSGQYFLWPFVIIFLLVIKIFSISLLALFLLKHYLVFLQVHIAPSILSGMCHSWYPLRCRLQMASLQMRPT